jgi:SAM-dependent methyltransferase
MKLTDFFLRQEQKVVDECLITKHGYELIWIGEDLIYGSRVSPIKRQLKIGFLPESAKTSVDMMVEKSALPFGQNSIDFIIFSHVLDLEKNPEILLKEAHRVLRLDGALLITGFRSFFKFFNFFNFFGLRRRNRMGRLRGLAEQQGFQLKKRYFFGSKLSKLFKSRLSWLGCLSPGYALLLEKQTIKLRPICKEQLLRAPAGSVFGVEGMKPKPLPSKNTQ